MLRIEEKMRVEYARKDESSNVPECDAEVVLSKKIVRRGISILVMWCVVSLGASGAMALDNDLVLSRLANFDAQPCGTDSQSLCGVAQPDQDKFNALAADLGQVFAPRLSNPAETLGEAGFAVAVMGSISTIDEQAAHWQDTIRDGDPPPSFFTGHLQLRKGLPFSFELAGNMSYLTNSEMFAVGADVKWALHEGFFYMPDVAVRGSINTVLGAEYLNLVNVGWDVSISKDFGLANVLSIAPFAGYQNLYTISSSRLINAYPQDPRPPQTSTSGEVFAPEFVFEENRASANRFFLGARLDVWILNFVLEGVIGNNVNQFTFTGGLDF